MELKKIDADKEFHLSKYTPFTKCMYTEDPTLRKCEKNKKQFFAGRKNTIKYAAKLNIPLFPSEAKCKQVVLGTTKLLLPYLVLPEHFIVLSSKPDVWSEELNNTYMFCSAMDFFNKNNCSMPIRLIITPDYMRTDKNRLRISAKEICQLQHIYNLTFYKYVTDDEEHQNVYFISDVKMKEKKLKKIKINVATNELFYEKKGQNISITSLDIHL